MNTGEEKVYTNCAWAKQITFRSGKTIIKVNAVAKKLAEFLLKHEDAKGYVTLGISEMKKPDDRGNTHCVWLDTWKLNQQGQHERTAQPAAPSPHPATSRVYTPPEDDVPF